jgi:transposase
LPVLTLDDRVPKDHPVRGVMSVIEGLDLKKLDARIAANGRQGGRPAIDPRILLGLWVYGTTQGESHASEIARRVRTDDVYRWICGGVEVSERALSGFRKGGVEVFDSLLTQVLAALMSEGFVELHRVAQDGTRVRAWCGADSFRRHATLEELLNEARSHLEAVRRDGDDPLRTKRARAAEERGAREREARIARALARLSELAAGMSDEEMRDKKAPRVSTTDPEAVRMKMGDGGFRPAYNVHFATAADGSGVIVGVSALDRGNDYGEIDPMLDQIEQRTGVRPDEMLVDGGFIKKEDIEKAEAKGTKVFAPEPKKKAAEGSVRAGQRSEQMRAFYERIESEEGKATYRHRGEVAELTNAHAKTRYGLSSLVMRGLKGALGMALLTALSRDVVLLANGRARVAGTTAVDEQTTSV